MNYCERAIRANFDDLLCHADDDVRGFALQNMSRTGALLWGDTTLEMNDFLQLVIDHPRARVNVSAKVVRTDRHLRTVGVHFARLSKRQRETLEDIVTHQLISGFNEAIDLSEHCHVID